MSEHARAQPYGHSLRWSKEFDGSNKYKKCAHKNPIIKWLYMYHKLITVWKTGYQYIMTSKNY